VNSGSGKDSSEAQEEDYAGLLKEQNLKVLIGMFGLYKTKLMYPVQTEDKLD
jgi:hypothetical protein